MFTLVIELLVNDIREDTEILRIGIKYIVKIHLFTGKILLAIENPLNVIERVKQHLKEFGEITGLSINWYKSEMMVLNNKEIKEIRKGC